MATKKKGSEIPACAGMTNEGGGEDAQRIIPNKGRRLQVAPTTRKLFDEGAKGEFLEWFAATCNCALSARKIGFHYRTVLRHWREDEAFGEDCEAALRMGYARLEELALRAAEEALKPKKRRRIQGDRAPPPEHFAMDPMTAVQLLREHRRHLAGLAGGSGRDAKPGAPLKRWSFEDAIMALDKKLLAFGARRGIRAEPMCAENEEFARNLNVAETVDGEIRHGTMTRPIMPPA